MNSELIKFRVELLPYWDGRLDFVLANVDLFGTRQPGSLLRDKKDGVFDSTRRQTSNKI